MMNQINRMTVTADDQKKVVDALKKTQRSKIHKLTRYAASVGAGMAVETGVMNATFAFGNGVSQALTGESLHGAGLAVTAGAAVVLGVGTGLTTAYAVEDGFDMVDEWRLEKANAHLKVLEDFESDLESDEDDAE